MKLVVTGTRGIPDIMDTGKYKKTRHRKCPISWVA